MLEAKDKLASYSTIFKLKEKLLELTLKVNKYIHTLLTFLCMGGPTITQNFSDGYITVITEQILTGP